MPKINLNEIEVGDVFSEQSHYVFLGKKPNGEFNFKHLGSDTLVNLNGQYVQDLLQTADQYQEEIEVGREDKLWTEKQINDWIKAQKNSLSGSDLPRVGDVRQKGIRTIWSEIHSSQVFTVSFNKQIKDKTKKALTEEKTKQLEEAVQAIEAAQKAKKGVAKAAEEAIKKIQENPILPTEPVEERILRGYKVQFSSITGKYDVVDMDLPDDHKGGNVRQVNVNEINYLVYNNTKYIVK